MSFALNIAAGMPLGLANNLVSVIGSNLSAAAGQAATSGDPLVDGRVSTLLRAIGGPSMAVTGEKTRLKGKIGLLLNSINPSMMARLARRNLQAIHGPGRVNPATLPAAPSRTRTHNHAAPVAHEAKVTDLPDRLATLEARARVFRGVSMVVMPVEVCESGGKMVGEVPEVDRPAGKTPLGWPWDKPLAIESSALPAAPAEHENSAAPVRVGCLIDLFA